MRRLLRVAVLAAPLLVVLAAPASAGQSRMTLDCGEGIGVIERTNGASWFGVDDGAVYTTRNLRIVDDGGVYEKSYGHVAGEVLLCEAAHDVSFEDENGDPQRYESTWFVELVRAR